LSPRELFAVGKIVKVFGLRGELIVQPMTDSPDRFKKLKRVYIGTACDGSGNSADEPANAMLERARVEPRGVRVKLAGVDDRSGAERLVGLLMFVDVQDRIRIPKGRYFIHDLLGVSVVDHEGKRVGILKDVLRLPAHDVYVIDGGGHEVMVPAVKEFITAIDLEKRTMRIKLIEGMVQRNAY
jgi:16S rRNA processing protein RimM